MEKDQFSFLSRFNLRTSTSTGRPSSQAAGPISILFSVTSTVPANHRSIHPSTWEQRRTRPKILQTNKKLHLVYLHVTTRRCVLSCTVTAQSSLFPQHYREKKDPCVVGRFTSLYSIEEKSTLRRVSSCGLVHDTVTRWARLWSLLETVPVTTAMEHLSPNRLPQARPKRIPTEQFRNLHRSI